MTDTTITTAPSRTGRSRTGTRGLPVLIGIEAKLFLRDVGNLFFVVLCPAVLLVGMGLAIPGMREPIMELPQPWQGLRPVDLFTPVMLCVAVATAGLTTVPAYLAGYRETGALRRMQTTPMQPQGVLLAQGLVQLIGAIAGASLALLVGRLVFGSVLPERPVIAFATFLLAAAAMFALGVLIGGLAPKGNTASGLGMLLYFPFLFLAGLWTPGPLMPDAVERVATFTPLGAAAQAMNDAWFGTGMPWLQVAVMVAWAVVVFLIAARTFKWET